MSRVMNEWLHESPLKDMAPKAIMVMLGLRLQKPSQKSKSKDHLKSLENRMKLSHTGEIMELLKEAEAIQKDLRVSNKPSIIVEISKKFTREMRNGNINSAMELLADDMQNGIPPLTDQILHHIKQEHPHGKDAHPEVLLRDIPEEISPIKFHSIDAERVLIPLDKNPGLRPIGTGEILRRIANKVAVSHIREDIISVVGSLKVCAGQETGCESLVHAMHEIYEDQLSEAVLLVDASNAFNTINRNAFLHNITIKCPLLARYARNCYYANIRLFIIGRAEIQSMEGTTQGDPTAMVIYAMATIPLILMLEAEANQVDSTTKTAAYTDDLTAAGTIMRLRNCWETLCSLGPKFVYFPERSKSWLIVKEKEVQKAQSVIKDINIRLL